MKADVLTVAAVVFVVGVLASSIDIKDVFEKDPEIVSRKIKRSNFACSGS